MAFEDGLDLGQQIDLGDVEKGSAFGGHTEETEAVTVLVPVGDLFDAGMFEVIGQGGLAGTGSGTGKDITASEGDPSLFVFGAERRRQ